MSLSNIFTPERPFGPIDQTFILDTAEATDVLELTEPLSTAVKNRYTHIHGRKGSGKTAVLSIYKGLAHLQNRPGANRVAQKKERIDGLVVEIVTWQKFHEMIQDVAEAVARTLYKNEFTEEIPLLPEKVEQSWTESIWEQIFTEVYNRYRQTTADGQLRFDQAQIGAVIKYIEGMDLLDDPKERRKVETHLLRRAKEEINNILDRHKLKCYVLFDSMEDYPVKNPTFLKVVGGFLRALARFEIQCPNACIVFALPEEIRPILFRLSSNKLKDFESRIELRWRARDLLRMAAHRYRLFLRLHDSDWYSHVRHIDFAQARGRQEFFQSLFPVPVTNEFGDQEEPVAYILRHTQLLPRHLLIFLNEIARVSHAKAGGWRRIDPESIVQGIRNVEEDVVGEILAPYGFLYEDIGNKLKTDLSTLPPIFSYGDLDAVVNRMRRRLGFDDHFSVWEMLFLIGVIGKIKKEPPVTNPHGVSYILAEFHYNHKGSIAFPPNEMYCFHPLFSRYVSAVSNRSGDRNIIYPRETPLEVD